MAPISIIPDSGPLIVADNGIHSATAQDIIQDVLEMLGVYAPGETINAADGQRGLSVLNDMLDVWSNESLACFAQLTQTFTLQPGVSQYSVGPGATINGPRPLRVMDAPGAAYLLDQNDNRYLMDVVDEMTWNIQTTAVANSDLPDHLWYDPQYPWGVINIWPTPTIGYTCSFVSYQQLGGFVTLQGTMVLPPGYKRAITTNLALSLKPYYQVANLDPLIVKEASESKASVKRNNMRTQIAVMDPELVSRGSTVYNIFNDRGAGRL